MYIKFNQDISDTYTNFIDEMTNITTQAASVHQQFYNEIQSIYPQIWANLIKTSKNITERKHFNQLSEHSQLKKLTEFADSLTHALDLISEPEDKMNYLEDPDIVSFFQELSQSNQGATSKHGK